MNNYKEHLKVEKRYYKLMLLLKHLTKVKE